MKTVVIFESVKGAGKTTLINELVKVIPNSRAFYEEVTLKPIKHIENKETIVDYYKNIINKIENVESDCILLDRFHYTKWSITTYEKDYFQEIERLLLDKFEVFFVFLAIDGEYILQRLTHTQNHRQPTGWKLNYDNSSIDDEAQKDIKWQEFFLKHQYKDTLINNKKTVDTNNLHLSIHSLKSYVSKILEFLSNSKRL
ncbi:MAG: hypothetical protein RI945_213 [Candidatus Parcubacteria bacterium]|jgi:thymidylate kinase